MTLDDEIARYREATRLALEQLDWCVTYLHSIRKAKIARALAKNKSAIAQKLEAGGPK